VHADVRGVRPVVLLEVDELLGDGQAPATELLRPVQPGVAGVVELALPLGVVRTPGGPVARGRGRPVAGDLPLEPGADLLAEALVLFAVGQVHQAVPPNSSPSAIRSTLPEGVRGSSSTTSNRTGTS